MVCALRIFTAPGRPTHIYGQYPPCVLANTQNYVANPVIIGVSLNKIRSPAAIKDRIRAKTMKTGRITDVRPVKAAAIFKSPPPEIMH